MPLILLTGYPSSGKTHRATQIFSEFRSRIESTPANSKTKPQLVLIPSHHASADPPVEGADSSLPYNPPSTATNPRDTIYNATALEKTARASEFSAIRRALSKNSIVIADGLNYIKGFRYQLWCEAKAAGTRCVVVHAAAREDEVKAWNRQRLEAWHWELDQEEEIAPISAGPKIGRDVMGHLMPESHTAVYGDSLPQYNGGTRSRSSSMGGGDSSDDDDLSQRRTRAQEDTMTLKSLYISKKTEHTDTAPEARVPDLSNTQPSTEHTPSAPPSPPSPTASLPYTSKTLHALIMRYEPPSPFTRWDTPLFTIPSSDTHPPYTQIWEAIFPPPAKPSRKTIATTPRNQPDLSTTAAQADDIRPHAATVLPRATSSSALQTLEAATADVVKCLLSAARIQGAADGDGGPVTFSVPTHPGVSSTTTVATATATAQGVDLEITIPTNMSLSQPVLQRLRRKYTQIQRGAIAHGQAYVSGREEVVRGFVGFLEAEWGE